MNLINNARDAFEDRNIENRRIVISVYHKRNELVIAVQDNAGGIDDTIQKKILTHTSHHIRLKVQV